MWRRPTLHFQLPLYFCQHLSSWWILRNIDPAVDMYSTINLSQHLTALASPQFLLVSSRRRWSRGHHTPRRVCPLIHTSRGCYLSFWRQLLKQVEGGVVDRFPSLYDGRRLNFQMPLDGQRGVKSEVSKNSRSLQRKQASCLAEKEQSEKKRMTKKQKLKTN
jgi:hypothetical protein